MKFKKLDLKNFNKKINISTRDEIFIITLIIVMLIFIIGKMYLIPLLGERERNKNRNTALESEYRKVTIALKNIDKKQELLDEENKKFKEKMKGFPSTPYSAQLLLDVKTIGDKNNVRFSSITLGKDSLKKNFNNVDIEMGEQPVNLNVSGDYKNIMTFVKDIEALGRIGVVNNITLSKKDTGELNGSMNINFCYFPMGKEKEKYDFNNGIYGKDNPFR